MIVSGSDVDEHPPSAVIVRRYVPTSETTSGVNPMAETGLPSSVHWNDSTLVAVVVSVTVSPGQIWERDAAMVGLGGLGLSTLADWA